MSSSRDEVRQQALSPHPQRDPVSPASRSSPPGDANMQDYVGSSHNSRIAWRPIGGWGSDTRSRERLAAFRSAWSKAVLLCAHVAHIWSWAHGYEALDMVRCYHTGTTSVPTPA